jgi:hypothetical protein
MGKICILIAALLFTVAAVSQKSNPTIGNNEFEISLLFFVDKGNRSIYYDEAQQLAGVHLVHRWLWKKYTKVGVGGLAGVQNYDPTHESDFVTYGALFGDITQFIGQRQKWCASGQIGHGIFKREKKIENTNVNGVVKHTAGMYYSISFNYRSIISKKILVVFSPVYTFRNLRLKANVEYYSTPSVEERSSTDKRSGPGIRLGIIF